MLRLMMRSLVLCVLALLLVPAGFSKSPEKLAGEDLKKAGESVSSNSLKTAAPSDATKADEAEAVTTPYAPAQNSSTDKTTASVEYKTAPIFTPMLATTGTIGMFTLETGETLPKGGFAFSAFGNKLGRMPGSVTVLEFGFDADYGVTDDLSRLCGFRSLRTRSRGMPWPAEFALDSNIVYLPAAKFRIDGAEFLLSGGFRSRSRLRGRLPFCQW